MDRLSEMKPLVLEAPIHLEVDLIQPIFADLAADIPGVDRVYRRTLAYTGADMLEVTRIWRLIINTSRGESFV